MLLDPSHLLICSECVRICKKNSDHPGWSLPPLPISTSRTKQKNNTVGKGGPISNKTFDKGASGSSSSRIANFSRTAVSGGAVCDLPEQTGNMVQRVVQDVVSMASLRLGS